MKKFILTLLGLFLLGCTDHKIITYQYLDENDKTVAVSVASGYSLLSQLNQVLRDSGYDVFVKNKNTDIGANNTKTRYELLTSITYWGNERYTFVISMVDLKDNTEVFNLSGTEYERDIIWYFIQLVNNLDVEELGASGGMFL